MFDAVRQRLLRILRVPHEPEPPAGAPGSIRVFRAGRNLYKLKLVGWAAGQIGALVGILFSLAFLHRFEREAEQHRENERRAAVAGAVPAPASESIEAGRSSAATGTTAPKTPLLADAPAADGSGGPEQVESKNQRAQRRGEWKQRSGSGLGRVARRSPSWFFPLLKLAEYAGILAYLVQVPVTYAMVRLDWEQRWYIVTDRSLRIRSGLATVLESTMSFANLQQVVVTQGPLQRLLGLADVRVQSAGGGGAAEHQPGAEPSLHTGVFHGVEHAEEIRDLILERLRLFRQAGLGDPDDHAAEPAAGPSGGADLRTAAQELLNEARALRQAVGTG